MTKVYKNKRKNMIIAWKNLGLGLKKNMLHLGLHHGSTLDDVHPDPRTSPENNF